MQKTSIYSVENLIVMYIVCYNIIGFLIERRNYKLSLSDKIMTDMKTAMKNHDKTTLDTVRMIKSASQAIALAIIVLPVPGGP
mgnify:CR=1 FL=1